MSVTVLYMAAGNSLDSMGYASLNGYTMHREDMLMASPWVLRDPNGDFVDMDVYRSKLAERNGFKLLDEYGTE